METIVGGASKRQGCFWVRDTSISNL